MTHCACYINYDISFYTIEKVPIIILAWYMRHLEFSNILPIQLKCINKVCNIMLQAQGMFAIQA